MTPRKSLRYDTTKPQLDVYLYNQVVGHIGQDGPDVWFKYTDSVQGADSREHQISVRMPVRAEVYDHNATLAFFDNLLLESDTRTALAREVKQDQRDVAGLLGQVGGECAGAVAIWPHGTRPPDRPEYRSYSKTQLGILFDEAHGEHFTQAQLESRQSMSGVQDKLVFRKADTSYDLPLNGAPGDVILKRPSPRYQGLVENEYVCQQLVTAIDLGAAKATALTGSLYLLESRRYDRHASGAGEIRRLHQEDFCQSLSRSPRAKYQRHQGPGFADISRAVRQYSAQPLRDLDRLIRVAILNVCIGNMDAHAKNFSFLYADDGIQLAPFYDVVSTIIYPTLDPSYSMYIGTASRPAELSPHALERFARELQVSPSAVLSAIDEVVTGIEGAWPAVSSAAILETGHQPVYDLIDRTIKSQSTILRAAARKRLAI